MGQLILIIHTSMDGFVAGKDGSFDHFDQSPENFELVSTRQLSKEEMTLNYRISH
ncbi:hypothetical protein OOZ15_07495 [Galbibacter sp. EGI 63066]|uniref:hypothetical protein n=1 Tax=Galbibacter sp. EGI 63066 TaxID=2993559 RepID=UPI002248A7CD|nr:hypothetical protein [Galbibacter sp. EGI 63066]MCX2679776.1 hypothetical protein [Galbibacter sp. EGI 63066]